MDSEILAENNDLIKSKNEADSKDEVVSDICRYMTTKLPAGCQLIDGHINIEYPSGPSVTHGVRRRTEISEHNIEESCNSDFMRKVVTDVQKISLPRMEIH